MLQKPPQTDANRSLYAIYMKQLFKYILWSALTFIFIVISYLGITNWILFNPNKKFAFQLEYKEFNVRSDRPIDESIKRILDSVSIRLTSILDYDEGVYQIYLCNNPETYYIFSKKVGKPLDTQGFNLQPINHIFINVSFVQEMKSRNNVGFKYHILEGSLSHIIAHEICHQLIADRIGFFRMRRIDSWKLEGFCEYSASKRVKQNDASYRFSELVANFLDGQFDNISQGRRFYIESMIIVEYYLENMSKNFSDLVENDIKKDILLQEIKSKNKEKGLYQRL